jgi:hypothetical protein
MRQGSRKLIITLSSLACYTAIMIVNAYTGTELDPFGLGMGLGFLLVPTSAAYAAEYRYSKKDQEEKV